VSQFLVITCTEKSIVQNSRNQRFSFQTLHFAEIMGNNTVKQVVYGELYSKIFLSHQPTTNSRVNSHDPFFDIFYSFFTSPVENAIYIQLCFLLWFIFVQTCTGRFT
jgi:hypothetical protein